MKMSRGLLLRPSGRIASRPRQRGPRAMNTFCIGVGSGNSVSSLPPTRLRASRTMTSAPAWASQVAATRPESPAPTTTTSHVRSPAMAGPAGIGAATRADTDEALNGGTTPAAAADSVINRRRFRLLLPVGAGADRISASSRLPNSSAGAGGAWFPPRKLDLSIGPDARARRFDRLTGYSGRRHLATRKAQRRGKKRSL